MNDDLGETGADQTPDDDETLDDGELNLDEDPDEKNNDDSISNI